MLSSTKPHLHQPRSQRTSSTISSPPIDIPHSTIPSSTPPTPGARRPSLSTTMHWLSRTATPSNTIFYPPSKPIKISEPKLVRGIDTLAHPRNGALGTGATVVRTPDEALRDTAVRITFDGKIMETPKTSKPKKERKASISKTINTHHAQQDHFGPISPPLPPLPIAESDEECVLSRSVSSEPDSRMSSPKRPSGAAAKSSFAPAPAPIPRSPSLRPSLKIRSTHSAEDVVPPLPSAVPTEFCSPFRPILMSEIPAYPVDPEKIIITLETCTAIHKTTLETLMSRPSHLSQYVESLLSRHGPNASVSSLYSMSSSDHDHMGIYQQHLTSQGLILRPFLNVHIFLDRPSAPYAHILTYLRSNPAASDNPEVIPRAIVYQQPAAARLEALIELRDEAAYLKLDALHKLCVDEIRKGHAPKMHVRGSSAGGHSINSVHSMQASMVTMQTLLENVVEVDPATSTHSLVASEMRFKERDSKDRERDRERERGRGQERERDNSLSDHSSPPSSRGPPTPHSWETGYGHTRNRSLPTARSLKNPPAGWI